MLSLMYITNNPVVACAADSAGVDRIMIDLEKLGKKERQRGWNSIISDHCPEDIRAVKKVLKQSEIIVRINPVNDSTADEVEEVIACGADTVMLPYFKSADEVEKFIGYIGGRVRNNILIETREAVECLDDILSVGGIDEVHIGLNDLSHSYNQAFLFEPFRSGIVDYIVDKLKKHGIKDYGIGGIARIGCGKIPAEDVLCEHYRLGSSRAILSREFCILGNFENNFVISGVFSAELGRIRRIEKYVEEFDEQMFEYHRKRFNYKIEKIISEI